MTTRAKYKLGELYDVSSGLSKPREEFGFGHPFVTFRDVFYNYFLPDQLSELANTTEKEIKSCSVKKGDIFLTRTSETMHELGMSSVALKDYPNATFNGFTKRLRLKEDVDVEIDPVYIGYYFRTNEIRNQVDMHATMTTRASLNSTAINSIEISIPDIKYQIPIGKILKQLDDKIELNRRTNHTLEQMAQTLFKKYFVTDIDPDNLPEGWSYQKVNDLFDITIGRTPPRNQQQWFTEKPADVKWISIKDMGISGIYISKTSEYLTKEAVKKFNIPVIPTNTAILSFKLTVGRVAITTEDMLSNEAIAHFIPKKSTKLSTEYTYLFLKNFDYSSLGNTSSIATAVNSQTVKSIDFLVPKESVTDEFYRDVKTIFEKIKLNQNEISTLIKLRDILLPKLMNGELTVN
ncbi:restriction endonuclease subunit S [Lacibacter sp. H407]|uniref:restriction endonuclease subunit S n=1 Tax=Lacibacter sp. H407 TaxID=3133423 RepID=UPI0030BA5DA5